MDVYWLIPAIHLLPSPRCIIIQCIISSKLEPQYYSSCAVSLYGALLRLVSWCHAHLHLVTPVSSPDPLLSSLMMCAWRDSLGGLTVSTVEEWDPPPGVLWRGHIHCTEHKVCGHCYGTAEII